MIPSGARDDERSGHAAAGHQIDCGELFDKLDLLLDRELPQAELDRLETHLAACLPCAGRRDFESQLRAVVRERCADQAPADLVARIRQKLELPTS